MQYYNLILTGLAAIGISTGYGRLEPNVPYIYYHDAYIDKGACSKRLWQH
ncbi:MAG: hypothetical protein IJI41_09995 [Anaerolineaceae bacterium]|nr:hypothetical protein [Anaerolineaceae bacterium]